MSLDRIDAAPLARALSLFGFGAAAAGLPGRVLALDLCERVIIATLYGSFAWRMLQNYSGHVDVSTMLIVFSEALPLLFVILRAPSATLSQRPTDWALAITATISPLMVQPNENLAGPVGPEALAYAIMLFGFCVQISAKAVLGRAFGIVAANHGVRQVGPYRFVRHPMYAGYTLAHFGFLLAMPSLFNTAVYTIALILQLVRITREEQVLMRDPIYVAFAKRVRYRLLPGVY
jgi:protein-S-isoprenylcysteine O-methyltransferase Ste14